MFQASDLLVLVLQTAPKTLAPASSHILTCWWGNIPATVFPWNSIPPWIPMTDSPAIPVLMYARGLAFLRASTPLRPPTKSASPADAMVSKSKPSAPAERILFPTYSMSRAMCSDASSDCCMDSSILNSLIRSAGFP